MRPKLLFFVSVFHNLTKIKSNRFRFYTCCVQFAVVRSLYKSVQHLNNLHWRQDTGDKSHCTVTKCASAVQVYLPAVSVSEYSCFNKVCPKKHISVRDNVERTVL